MSANGSGEGGGAPPTTGNCEHGISFPSDSEYREATEGMSVSEIRKRWPRHSGVCPRCGYNGIYYASYLHYIVGDW